MHDLRVLYILATDPVDASVFAAKVLGIPLRDQNDNAVALCRPNQLPARFTPRDEVRATPTAWDNRDKVGVLWSSIIARKGTILPPYDYPQTMSSDLLEAWLES